MYPNVALTHCVLPFVFPGMSSLYMGHSPTIYHQTNNIHAAAAAGEYHSDSAESLAEIPVSKTHTSTSVYHRNASNDPVSKTRCLPPSAPQGLKDSSTFPRARRKKRKTRVERQKNGVDMTAYDIAMAERPHRHSDVPPLDLSSLNSDDDEYKRSHQEVSHI